MQGEAQVVTMPDLVPDPAASHRAPPSHAVEHVRHTSHLTSQSKKTFCKCKTTGRRTTLEVRARPRSSPSLLGGCNKTIAVVSKTKLPAGPCSNAISTAYAAV